jgi:hypothetical protein
MLLTLGPDQALELIESPELMREDQVIPGHFRPVPGSPYGPGYDWIYRYEGKLARFLEPLLQYHQSELTGEKGLLYQALSNAFCHAHHKDRLKPITVSVLLGEKGLIVRVSDCGKGFNVPRVYKHCMHKKRYLTSVGNGIRFMAASPHFGVFYNQKGTQINLLYLFKNGLGTLSSDLIAAAPGQQIEYAGKKGAKGWDGGHRSAS